MKVAYLHRKPFEGQVSIERVFRNVAGGLPETIEPARFECPFPTKGFASLFRNGRAAARVSADVLHITGDVHYLALMTASDRTVLTIHDLVNLRRLRGIRRSLFKALWYTMPARRVAAVTAVSEKTRDELEAELPFLKGRVRVVPNPVDPLFQPLEPAKGGSRPTILQIGTRRNKNVERLIKAVADMDCRLIVVGKLTSEQKELAATMKGELISRTAINDEELLELYRQADLVTFVSTYEGFGLPIVEAQSVGRPVVTSNIRPMLEVAGGAAVYVNPFDFGAIRAGIRSILDDASLTDRLISAGFANVRRFSVQRVGQQYAQVYAEVTGQAVASVEERIAA